jgi:hypothetical protein
VSRNPRKTLAISISNLHTESHLPTGAYPAKKNTKIIETNDNSRLTLVNLRSESNVFVFSIFDRKTLPLEATKK